MALDFAGQYVKAFERLQADFKKHSNKHKASQMEAYLKNKFSFFGINADERRQLLKKHFAVIAFPSEKSLIKMSNDFYKLPEREFQLCAVDLLISHKSLLTPYFLPQLKKLIRSKSWWDTVDFLSSYILGHLAKNQELKQSLNNWITDNNMWIRRSAILFQLKYKQTTDWEILKNFILQERESKEFFIQKAMGWALREYSKTNAKTVVQFIKSQTLPALTKREGLKYINKQ